MLLFGELPRRVAAGKHELRESRLLIVGATDEGQVLDEEHIRDLLSLTCIQAVEERVESHAFDSQLTDMLDAMSTEVNEGNTTYLYQEEAVIEAQRRDLKATYDAKIRDLEGKERAAQFSPSD